MSVSFTGKEALVPHNYFVLRREGGCLGKLGLQERKELMILTMR